MNERIKIILLSILFFLLFFSCFLFALLRIYFIDVGQGDAALVVTPNNKTLLIDAGDITEFYDYGEDVYNFIKELNVKKLDAVIISHPHKDHIGGMAYILSKIKVDTFYDPGFPYPSETYFRLLELVNEKKISYKIAREDVNVNLDPSVEIQIVYPPKVLIFDSPNDNSVVVRIKYKNIAVLFTGDIEKNAEDEIVKKYKNKPDKIIANILKVPHHGSNTSSTINFIKLVMPETAIISCGKNNRFGHPHRSIIQRYKNYGVEIFRTDIDGTIEIEIDGQDYKIKTR